MRLTASFAFLVIVLLTSFAARVLAVSPNVVSLSVAQGSVRGGTLLTVAGSGFVSTGNLQCLFGTTPTSQATFVSSNIMFCKSPPHDVGPTAVSVSYDSRKITAQTLLCFIFEVKLL